MNSWTSEYEICFDRIRSRMAVRYVTFRSFSVKEFPIAVWRMLSTREFVIYAGIPASILLLGELISRVSETLEIARFIFTFICVIWLLIGLFRILRFGKSRGICCFSIERNTYEKHLVGGLRMKVHRQRLHIRIAGAFVDPLHRSNGIFTALLFALFRIAYLEVADGRIPKQSSLRISVFAPAHPASQQIVRTYFNDKQDICVDPKEDSVFMKSLTRLEHETSSLEKTGIKFTFSFPLSNVSILF